jgi:hypothetical protein
MPQDAAGSHKLIELIRRVLRTVVMAASVAATPMIAPAQEPAPPPAPNPAAPQAPQTVSPQESLAMAREDPIVVDSIRRLRREQMDSALRARDTLRARRRAAARGATREESPMFGRPPFFGYTWVFYADILAGAIIGLALFLTRHQASDASVPGWRAVGAAVVGGIGGACVFVFFFLLAVLGSALLFFRDGPSAIALLGWTLGAMMLTLLLVTVLRRQG